MAQINGGRFFFIFQKKGWITTTKKTIEKETPEIKKVKAKFHKPYPPDRNSTSTDGTKSACGRAEQEREGGGNQTTTIKNSRHPEREKIEREKKYYFFQGMKVGGG